MPYIRNMSSRSVAEMKYKDGNFIQLSRVIFDSEYITLSDSAKRMYCYLSELEHRYTGDEKNWFYKQDYEIANALNWSISKVQRAKKELEQAELVRVSKTKSSKSTRHITAYEILK